MAIPPPPPGAALREEEYDGAASKIPAVLLVLGLATVSMAINTAAAKFGLGNGTANYSLAFALAGAFLSGVAMISASVWVSGDSRGRSAAGKTIIYASMAPLVLAVGLAVAALLCG